jgi:hypothetical protein
MPLGFYARSHSRAFARLQILRINITYIRHIDMLEGRFHCLPSGIMYIYKKTEEHCLFFSILFPAVRINIDLPCPCLGSHFIKSLNDYFALPYTSHTINSLLNLCPPSS